MATAAFLDLWQAHVKMLTTTQLSIQCVVGDQIRIFYENVVSAGFAGSPLNNDVTNVIAEFLAPNLCKFVLIEGETFSVLHGVKMINVITRAWVIECFFDEMLKSFACQAAQGGVDKFTFVAGHDVVFKGQSGYQKGGLKVGPNASTFYRDWMAVAYNSQLLIKVGCDFTRSMQLLGLPMPSITSDARGCICSMSWTIPAH